MNQIIILHAAVYEAAPMNTLYSRTKGNLRATVSPRRRLGPSPCVPPLLRHHSLRHRLWIWPRLLSPPPQPPNPPALSPWAPHPQPYPFQPPSRSFPRPRLDRRSKSPIGLRPPPH